MCATFCTERKRELLLTLCENSSQVWNFAFSQGEFAQAEGERLGLADDLIPSKAACWSYETRCPQYRYFPHPAIMIRVFMHCRSSATVCLVLVKAVLLWRYALLCEASFSMLLRWRCSDGVPGAIGIVITRAGVSRFLRFGKRSGARAIGPGSRSCCQPGATALRPRARSCSSMGQVLLQI